VQVDTDFRNVTPKTVVVTIEGYIQTKEARQLQRTLKEIDERQAKRVVFDLSSVAYASSAALGLFVTYSNRKKEEEGTNAVAIVGLSRNIMNVLRTLGLLPLFLLCETVDEALKELGVPAS